MFQRDYFLRMVETFAKALARIIFLKEQKQWGEAQKEADEAGKLIVGRDYPLIKNLSDLDLIKLVTTEQYFDFEKCKALAELLKVEGEMDEALGRPAHIRYCQSLSLYLEMIQQKSGLNDLPVDEVEWLLNKLEYELIPARLHIKLFHYYARTEIYSKAMDVLEELVDSGDPAAQPAGVLFCRRLLEMNNEELASNGLNRNRIMGILSKIENDWPN